MRDDSVAVLGEVISGSWLRGRSSIGQNQTEVKGGNVLREVASDGVGSGKNVERGPLIGWEVTAG
jgi:hypothetical protein